MAEIDPKIAQDFLAVLNSMAEAIASLKKPVSEFNREFAETSSVSRDIATSLGRIVSVGKDLPKGVKTTNDLSKKMLGNEKLFEQMKKKVLKIQEQELTKYWHKKISLQRLSSGLGWKEFKQTEKYKTLLEKMEDIRTSEKQSFEDQFAKMKNKEAAHKKENASIKALKDALIGARSKAEELSGLNLSGGLLAFGISVLVKSFTSLKERIEEALKATAMTTRTFGSMGDVTKQTTRQAIGMGQQFERLGLSLATGQQAVNDFVHATKQLVASNDLKEIGVRLTQVVGMSADEAGRLSIAFDRAGLSEKQFKGTMEEATAAATAMNIPVNDLIQSMGKNINVLQRFGMKNRTEFIKASGMALLYGTSIEKIEGPLWEQLGTFDKASSAAAKLNAIFGTHINSYELMLAESPLDNLQLISKELITQGKSWENMNLQEKRVLKNTIGIDEEMASLILSEKNVALGADAITKAFVDQEKKQKKLATAQKNWDEGLRKLKETVINFPALFKGVFAEFGRVVVSFFAGLFGSEKSPDKLVQGMFTNIEVGFKTVENFLKNNTGTAKTWGETLRHWLKEAATFIEDKFIPAFEKIEKLLDRFDKFSSNPVLKAFLGETNWSGQTPEEAYAEEQRDKKAGVPNSGRVGFSVKDALITKTGQVIKFNPQDNIIATKSPINRTAQGVTATAGKATSSEQNITIMPAPIYLDGKVIAEVLFRQSRR